MRSIPTLYDTYNALYGRICIYSMHETHEEHLRGRYGCVPSIPWRAHGLAGDAHASTHAQPVIALPPVAPKLHYATPDGFVDIPIG